MKMWILLLFPILLLCSCKEKKRGNTVLTTTNLKSQQFRINPNLDTVLRTSHNAIISIKHDSFGDHDTVQIEIKEAYTPDEMLAAGLTTNADGKPLRSAGMVYFNASSGGKNIEPVIPITIRVLAKDPDPEMMLFKGEESDQGINWTDPSPIVTSDPYVYGSFEAGKALFTKCRSCHKIFKEGAYPALKDLQYRGPWKNPINILAWVNNPARFMASDPYTRNLQRKFKSMMTAFPDLTMQDINNILIYINSAKIEDDNNRSA